MPWARQRLASRSNTPCIEEHGYHGNIQHFEFTVTTTCVRAQWQSSPTAGAQEPCISAPLVAACELVESSGSGYLVRVGLAAHEDEVFQGVGEAVMVVGLGGCRGGEAACTGAGETPRGQSTVHTARRTMTNGTHRTMVGIVHAHASSTDGVPYPSTQIHQQKAHSLALSTPISRSSWTSASRRLCRPQRSSPALRTETPSRPFCAILAHVIDCATFS